MRRSPRVRGRIVDFDDVCGRAGIVIAADRVNLAVQGSGSEFLARSGHWRQRLPTAAVLGRSAPHECEASEQSQDAGCLFHKRVQMGAGSMGIKALYQLTTGKQTQGSQNVRNSSARRALRAEGSFLSHIVFYRIFGAGDWLGIAIDLVQCFLANWLY